jgi:hypothetical protein
LQWNFSARRHVQYSRRGTMTQAMMEWGRARGAKTNTRLTLGEYEELIVAFGTMAGTLERAAKPEPAPREPERDIVVVLGAMSELDGQLEYFDQQLGRELRAEMER